MWGAIEDCSTPTICSACLPRSLSVYTHLPVSLSSPPLLSLSFSPAFLALPLPFAVMFFLSVSPRLSRSLSLSLSLALFLSHLLSPLLCKRSAVHSNETEPCEPKGHGGRQSTPRLTLLCPNHATASSPARRLMECKRLNWGGRAALKPLY